MNVSCKEKGNKYDHHIEIYGPDKQLIATDMCAEKNNKSGLAFLKKWIKADCKPILETMRGNRQCGRVAAWFWKRVDNQTV